MNKCIILNSKRVENRQWIKVRQKSSNALEKGDFLYINKNIVWQVIGVLQHVTDSNIRSAILIDYIKDDIWEYFVKPIDHNELIAEGTYFVVHTI